MAILEGLQQFFESLQAQVINIPLDNPLAYVYVVLNLVLSLFNLLTGGTISNTGSIFDFF